MAYARSLRRLTGRRPVAPARKMGSWKLAYADFLTALCAFFLVMWIVHGVSADDKTVLADQFQNDGATVALKVTTIAPSQAHQLAAQLRANPDLLGFESSVSIAVEDRAIRINLTDMAVRPLFETGKGQLNETGRQLVAITGAALAPLPGSITIEGHTDSIPSDTPGYTNWELSSDRANSAREIIEAAGVTHTRIAAVTGLAATKPLLKQTPHLPANRRISIVLHLGSSAASTGA